MSIPCFAVNTDGQIYYFDVQIVDKTLPFPPEKPRKPAQTSNVLDAMYDVTTNVLQLYFKQDIENLSISIKCDDKYIVSDNFFINAGDSLFFSFVENNFIECEIIISTINGESYIGYFVNNF